VVQHGAALTLTCDLDCTYVAQLYRLPGHLLVSKRGRAIGGKPMTLPLRAPKPKALYRLRLSAIAAVNPGKAATLLLSVRHG
jgi:sulfopyruvate decarboxylase TPP-binding subunit